MVALVEPKVDATQAELAAAAARAFEATVLSEDNVVDKFIEKHGGPSAAANTQSKKRTHSVRELLDREPACIGEQVAAKVSKSNEDGSWILGNVLDYDPRNQVYAIQDEDDVNRVVQLHAQDVRRLEDTAAALRRGDDVLAVFPETTSFYRAVVAKNPRPPHNSMDSLLFGNAMWEVVVRFEDDEDETGKNPARRVPARFVLRRSVMESYEEDDDSEDD
eukprot:scaffold7068_cov179-Ochromonas_danica.AAC.10